MAKITLETKDTIITKIVNDKDKIDTYNLTLAIKQAIQAFDAIEPNDKFGDRVVGMISEKEQQTITRLATTLGKSLELISKIRFTDWSSPQLREALNAEEIDELLQEGDAVLNYTKRKNLTKPGKTKES